MQKTAFIVGAGASKDWSFPLGSELNDQIRIWLDQDFGSQGNPSSPIAQTIMQTGLRDTHSVAALKLRDGLLGASSIDRLLHSRNDDSTIKLIGKIGIAASILEHESKCVLSELRSDNRNASYDALQSSRFTWLAILLNSLCSATRLSDIRSAFEKTSFVVFNYDRCIEQYIYHALIYIFDQTVQNAREIVQGLDIVHVYGTLGDLPIINDRESIPFGSRADYFSATAAANIRVFTEGAVDGHLERARKSVSDAEQLVFLGFGFDELNMKAILPDGPKAGQSCCGTMWLPFRRRDELLSIFQSTHTDLDSRGFFVRQPCGDAMNYLLDNVLR